MAGWPDLGLATIPAALTGLVAVIAQLIYTRSASVRDLASDRRSLRDARHGRLRRAYATLLATFEHQQAIMVGMSVVFEGETVDQRDARFRGMLQADRERWTEAFTELELEAEQPIDEIRQLADDIPSIFMRYMNAIAIQGRAPGTTTAGEFEAMRGQMGEHIDRLRVVMRGHLANLDRPI